MLTRKQLAELRDAPLAGPNKVRKAMNLSGTTQVQLADAIDVTQPHISRIVNGNCKRLPVETSRAIAEFFGGAIEDLFPRRAALRGGGGARGSLGATRHHGRSRSVAGVSD